MVIRVCNHACPTKKMSTLVVGNDSDVCKAGFTGDDAVGHDSGMCKAGSPGDDASTKDSDM